MPNIDLEWCHHCHVNMSWMYYAEKHGATQRDKGEKSRGGLTRCGTMYPSGTCSPRALVCLLQSPPLSHSPSRYYTRHAFWFLSLSKTPKFHRQFYDSSLIIFLICFSCSSFLHFWRFVRNRLLVELFVVGLLRGFWSGGINIVGSLFGLLFDQWFLMCFLCFLCFAFGFIWWVSLWFHFFGFSNALFGCEETGGKAQESEKI